MAEVSDYDVASGSRILFGARDLTTRFYSGGRNSGRRAVLHLSALGGYLSGSESMSCNVALNGRNIGSFIVGRWVSRDALITNCVLMDFNSDYLANSGPNNLVFRPNYANSRDYFFIGPVIVNFRQNS